MYIARVTFRFPIHDRFPHSFNLRVLVILVRSAGGLASSPRSIASRKLQDKFIATTAFPFISQSRWRVPEFSGRTIQYRAMLVQQYVTVRIRAQECDGVRTRTGQGIAPLNAIFARP